MSLPPGTVKLLLDFLAAVGSLLYVVGGYFLGKWQSDESECHLLTYLKPVVGTTVYELPYSFLDKILQALLGSPDLPIDPKLMSRIKETDDYKEMRSIMMDFVAKHFEEAEKHLKSLEIMARRSKWIGITCVAVGTALFLVRLMI